MSEGADTEKRVALVTGGTRGIGLGIARELAKCGFDLALNGRRGMIEVTPVLDELRKAGARVEYQSGDVADSSERQQLVDAVWKAYGRLDVLVNNAGIAPPERVDIMHASEESYDLVMNINLKAPYFLSQLVARLFQQQYAADNSFRGCIVNIGSVSGELAGVNRGEYCLSRTATTMATKLWAARLAEFGSTAYEVRPGIIKTDMTAAVRDKYTKLIEEGMLVESRWGEPSDIGRAVAMLAGGGLSYAPGQVLTIDGGMTLGRL